MSLLVPQPLIYEMWFDSISHANMQKFHPLKMTAYMAVISGAIKWNRL